VESSNAGSLAGMADPAQPDIYMELDVLGEDQMPERYTREDIASRFSYHGFAFHLDDGVFGGGQILPAVDSDVTLAGATPSAASVRTANFAAGRCGVFRYVVAVNEVEPGFGQARKVVKDATGTVLCGSGDMLVFESDFFDIVTDFESIVWIHEFGHTLGLCHLPGDNEAMALGTGGCTGSCPPNTICHCAHYSMDRWDDSAMGAGFSFPWIDDLIQGIDREIDYHPEEWAVIDLRPIATTSGCP